MCIVNSMNTEAINHGPGVTFMQTGSQFPGRPSMGAWLSYVLVHQMKIYQVLWFLKRKERWAASGVQALGKRIPPRKTCGHPFHADRDAILYLNSPDGVTSSGRRNMLDRPRELHELQLAKTETQTRDPNRPIRNGLSDAKFDS